MQNQLSELLSEPVLKTVSMDLNHGSVEQVNEVHEQLWERFVDPHVKFSVPTCDGLNGASRIAVSKYRGYR